MLRLFKVYEYNAFYWLANEETETYCTIYLRQNRKRFDKCHISLPIQLTFHLVE